MNKRIVIILLAVLLTLGGAAYYYFLIFQKNKDIDTWDFVPETAAMVYESSQVMSAWKEFSGSALWENLASIPQFDSVGQHVQLLDSLTDLNTFFQKRQVLISMHVVARDQFDFTYYFKLNDSGEFTTLKGVLDQLSEKKFIRHEVRNYNNFHINELIDTRNGKRFSYIVHHNIFAGSFTPFLIEDIVRNIDTDFEQFSFLSANPNLQELPKIAEDEGNLYVNTRKIPLVFSMFAGKDFQTMIKPLEYLAYSSFMDVNLTDKQLLFNGYSILPHTDSAESSLLGTFQNQQPQPLGIKSFISDRTAMLVHMTFSDGEAWQKDLFQYQQSYDQALSMNNLKARTRLANENISLTSFFQSMEKEVGLLTLESVDINAPEKAAIIGVNDSAKVLQVIRQMNEQGLNGNNEPAYEENFGQYKIREVQFRQFPSALFGPAASGFDQSFFVFSDGYWIIANNVKTLKRLLLDQEAENTWDRSVPWNTFLETTADQANYSIMVNTSRIWPMFVHTLSPEWQKFAQQYAQVFRQFERFAIQFSQNEAEFYTSIDIDYVPTEAPVATKRQFETTQQIFLDNAAASQPFVVINNYNQEWETLVQDDSNYLYLASTDGQVLWKDSVSGEIIGEVEQIDFFKDGNYQYVFATANAVHIVDRSGTEVEGYPLYMPEEVVIQSLSVVDYDNSKDYRFLVADQTGKLWMYNKDRENLEGWNPRPLNTPLASPPDHVRVRDRDFIVAVQQDGTINLLNRRGDLYGGFPITLNTEISSPVFISQNSGLSNSTITTVTAKGELVSFNFKGNTIQRDQLYRPASETRFNLCLDATGKTFLIIRKDADRLGILDKGGKVIMEQPYISSAALTSNKVSVQYYDFGAGNMLFSITDKVQEFTYLYDSKGNLIKDRPVESAFDIGVLYFENEGIYHVYHSYGNECGVISFAR